MISQFKHSFNSNNVIDSMCGFSYYLYEKQCVHFEVIIIEKGNLLKKLIFKICYLKYTFPICSIQVK